MNLLAELSSAGAPASGPAASGGRTGHVPAPAESPFADLLGAARVEPAGPAGHGAAAMQRPAATAQLTAAEEQLQDTPAGEHIEAADSLAAAIVLLAEAATPIANPAPGPAPQGAGSRLAGLPDSSVDGKPLPPAKPHGGNPLPPQAGSGMNPGSQSDLRSAILTALRPDGTQALAVSANAGIAEESTTAARLPAGSERVAEAGNLLRHPGGLENLPDVAVTVRPGTPVPVESAAAVFDPRAMLEANARQHRPASAQTAALEALDRTAPGLESAEPASRPLVARPVPPTLLARDLSAVADRIETLAQRPGGIASVSVSLGDLGNVEISVRMEARQAHVQFVVQDVLAREVLEAQLPRLRAMLEESGLKLGDVNTGLPGKSERDANGERPNGHAGATTAAYDDRESLEHDRPGNGTSVASSHLLDAFA